MRRYAAFLLLLSLGGCAMKPAVYPNLPDDVVADVAQVASRDIRMPVTLVVPAVSDAPMPLVVMMHGHGGTREEAGSFIRVASALAQGGVASVRMDFAGSGESTETFANNDLTSMAADVRAAIAWARTRASIDTSRLGAIGFSMGGRVAARLMDEGQVFKSTAMWAPSLYNGARTMVTMLGGEASYAAMKTQAQREGFAPFTTFWGQPQQLGARWFSDLERSRPMDAIAAYRGALLLVHGTADDVVPVAVSRVAAKAAVHSAQVQLVEIDGADHGFGLFAPEDRFSDQLVDATVTFLLETL
ncbi:MAG: alpha/beta fold hydrolase [Pseudomonadota bacterium]